jgi:imidazolonepropionase-like amidohydrolase
MQAFRKTIIRGCFVSLASLFVAALVLARGPGPFVPPVLALVGGKVISQTDAGVADATVLIRDGKIAAVGRDIAIPQGAKKIDVTGMVITPGLIDARGSLWLSAASNQDTANDAGLDILDDIDPTREDWKEVARQGVTAVYVQPSHSSLLGGRGAVLRVGPAEAVEDIVIKASAAAQASLGAAPPAPVATETPAGGRGRRGGRGRGQQAEPAQAAAPAPGSNSLTRYAQYEQLRRTLEAAKKYDDDWMKVEKADFAKAAKADKAKAGADKKAVSAKSSSSGSRPKHDPAKDFLRKVVGGQIPLRLEAHREDDVNNALRLVKELKLRLVLEGVSNPRAASEAIVQGRIPLVLGPFADIDDALANHIDRPAEWPKSLLGSDGRFAIGTYSTQARGSRLLRVHAAAAVAQGLDPAQVLRAVTRDAADILGVGDKLGTIEAGKIADLAVFAGDPLDPSVPVRITISGGKITYDATAAPNSINPTYQTAATSSSNGKVARAALSLPSKLPKKYALKTNRLLKQDGEFTAGVVVIDGGRISEVGTTAPDGVTAYDLGAAVVAPGLVASYNDLGQHTAVDDAAEADAGFVRTADALDPHFRPLRELIEGGYTAALFVPGSVNVVAGAPCGVRLGATDSLVGDLGQCFVLAQSAREGPRGSASNADDVPPAFAGRRGGRANPPRFPGSLGGQIQLIEQVLGGKAPSTELYVPNRVRQQIQHARDHAIKPLLERKSVAFFEAHNRAEVGAALQLIERFKLKGVLVNPVEIRPYLDDIKRLGVGIVASSVHAGGYDRPLFELVDASLAGIPVSFGSGSAQDMRTTAALAVNAGMPREAAYRGLTTTAAQSAGLQDSYGRIAPGGAADLVIWDGAPLDLRSRPLCVLVDGKEVFAAR